jgi:hypothetical protein
MVIIPRDSFEWSPMPGGLATDLVSVWNGPFRAAISPKRMTARGRLLPDRPVLPVLTYFVF